MTRNRRPPTLLSDLAATIPDLAGTRMPGLVSPPPPLPLPSSVVDLRLCLLNYARTQMCIPAAPLSQQQKLLSCQSAEARYEPVHPYRTHIRVSGTAVSRTGGSQARRYIKLLTSLDGAAAAGEVGATAHAWMG